MNERSIEAVLRAVELIPPGRVVSYGDLAELTGLGPRQVGWIMAHYGGDVAWWRVTNAKGDLVPLAEALPHWAEEAVALKPNRRGCQIDCYRADLVELAARWQSVVADLGAACDHEPEARPITSQTNRSVANEAQPVTNEAK